MSDLFMFSFHMVGIGIFVGVGSLNAILFFVAAIIGLCVGTLTFGTFLLVTAGVIVWTIFSLLAAKSLWKNAIELEKKERFK